MELTRYTREGELSEKLEGERIRCLACGHRCPIPSGFSGACRVRSNRGGKLLVPFGYVNTVQCDPIEKKPFFHALPGTNALSFGMLGCCFHCPYCQNWVTSQALKDFRATLDAKPVQAKTLAALAVRWKAASVVSTYNEPLITSEWAVAVFRQARARGLTTGYVSNGNATSEVLQYLRPWLDLYKVDLKSMDDHHYHELGGRLQPVLDSIDRIHAMGFWLEVVTLVVPGFNDSDQELRAIAGFLRDISPDIPWHVTAFHREYKMGDTPNTSREELLRAAAIGRETGLRFVYAGNLPGQVGELENTRCPYCRALLVERWGHHVLQNRISAAGTCPQCRAQIAGFWRRGPPLQPEDELVIQNRCG